MESTLFNLAERFVGIKEVSGASSNPEILKMLRLDDKSHKDDVVPWSSAFVNYIAWLLRYPRSKSLRARSWLNVGEVVELSNAKVGFDVVILKRGRGRQPGPEVIKAIGHVGFFAGINGNKISILGGNQNDMVSIQSYPSSRVLGIRRLKRVSQNTFQDNYRFLNTLNSLNQKVALDSFGRQPIPREKYLLSNFAYSDLSVTHYKIDQANCDVDIDYSITSFNNDAIDITADDITLNFTKSGSIIDNSKSKKHHRDGIQIFHVNRAFAAGRVKGVILKNPKILASDSNLQCIFSSDGIIENITIQNADLETQGEHAISLCGLLSGHIHVKKIVGENAILQFFPIRIGGGNRIWIAQPDDESLYSELICLGVAKSKIKDYRLVFSGESKEIRSMTDLFWRTKVKGHKNANVYKNFPLRAFEKATEVEVDLSRDQTHIASEAERISRRYYEPFKKDNERVQGQLVLMADSEKIYHYF